MTHAQCRIGPAEQLISALAEPVDSRMHRADNVRRMANRSQIPVFQGANAWRLIRTDRDGASAGDIPQMTAAAVRFFLLGGTGLGAKHELVATGPSEWRFGPVRPLKILGVHRAPISLPPGRPIADRQTSVPGTIPTVTGQKPWFINVIFHWRAPNTRIDFPALHEGIFGRSYQLNGADWILDKAAQLAVSEPDDRTWGDAMGDRAAAAAKSATEDLGQILAVSAGLGLLALLYLLSRRL